MSDPRPSRPGNAVAIPAWIGAVTLLGLLSIYRAHTLAWTADDAFVSFRYAANLVSGHGLVFNVGERVEGFTNLSWTLWVAVGIALGIDAESWSIWSGLCCHAAMFAALAHASRLFGLRERLWPALPLAAICAASHEDLLIYATSGLETPLFSLLLLLLTTGVAAAPQRWLLSGCLLSSLVLTRPDGLLVYPAVFAYLILQRMPWLRTAAVCALVLGAAWTWRLSYYGDWDDVMQLLRRRGARITDFTGVLDDYIKTIDERTQQTALHDPEHFDRFYFRHNDDQARRAPITALIPTLRRE